MRSTQPESLHSTASPTTSSQQHAGHTSKKDISSTTPASITTPKLLSSSSSLASTVQAPFQELSRYKDHLFNSRSGPGDKTSGTPLDAIAEPFTSSRKWNTQDLGKRIGGDFAAAAAAGGMVAPVITVIDKGIIENASNVATLSSSVRTSLMTLFLRPHKFLSSKPFLLIFTLYGGTYLSANMLDTVNSTLRNKPASNTTTGTSKFFATSAANLSLCLYKDNHFTRMFGAASSSTQSVVPRISYALFAVRDSLTVFASFNLPPVIAPMLPVSQEFERYMSRASAAQFLAPAAIQILSTPLHLLGLDLYNRPGVSPAMRATRVVRDWGKSFLARVCRILPAFGVGGVVNMRVRRTWMEQLE